MLQENPFGVFVVQEVAIATPQACLNILSQIWRAIHCATPTSRAVWMLLDASFSIQEGIAERDTGERHIAAKRLWNGLHRIPFRVN